MDRLWAPWRLEYVGAGERPAGCILCAKLSADDRAEHVVRRGERCFVVLNRYPYGQGHLMVAPNRHLAAPGDLDAGERAELWQLLDESLAALGAAFGAHGYNAGI